jgi:hypothetical protein
VLPPTLTPPTPGPSTATFNGRGTYGDLLARATRSVEAAQSTSGQPFADASTAHAELLGYERFLHVAGIHLQLLNGLARTPSAPLRKLASHLTNLRSDGATQGRWYDAATLLGTAHDLIATHLKNGLLPRTPQAEELLTQPAAERSGRHVTELVLAAISTRQQLFRSAQLSQRRLPGSRRPITKTHTRHLTSTTSTIEVYAMAALWGLDQSGDPRARDTLADLPPAAVMAPAPRSPGFTGSLEALAVLRQLIYSQARGDAVASPASLRDLALLGARFTASTESLPVPQTGFDRVQHAHALDTFETAHHAWVTASRDLTTTVQGLTKAPGMYGAAVHRLLESEPNDKALHAAVFAALPRLGREASQTITELGRNGALLTPQHDLQLRRTWAALPDNAVAQLADRFRTAGQATARAWRTAQAATHHAAGESEVRTAPVPSRSQNQGLEVQR